MQKISFGVHPDFAAQYGETVPSLDRWAIAQKSRPLQFFVVAQV